MARRLFPRFLFALACFVCTTSLARRMPELIDPPEGRPASYRVTRGFAAGLEYISAQPADLPPDAELPMVIYLHGRHSRPVPPIDGFMGVRVPIRVVIPRAPIAEREGRTSWMPISAHEGETPLLRAEMQDRLRVLEEAVGIWTARHPTRGRPILIGFSQGAILATALALQSPERFAAAMPVSTWLPPSFEPQGRAPRGAIAIHAMHGARDPVLPAARTRRLFDRLSHLGYRVSFEQYPDARHELDAEMRERLRERIEQSVQGLTPAAHTSGNS